jgi:hypothetical protein
MPCSVAHCTLYKSFPLFYVGGLTTLKYAVAKVGCELSGLLELLFDLRVFLDKADDVLVSLFG